MTLRALIFDVDGTLADTEEAHRQAFNQAFLEHRLGWSWSPSLYSALLSITGGKERMHRYIDWLDIPQAEARRLHEIVPLVHRTKARHFAELVEMGGVPFRPGIVRLIAEARAAGLRVALASTTTAENVTALVLRNAGRGGLGWFDAISTGDVVHRKKPAPDIYRHALATLGIAAERCAAFEDSELGVLAAQGAGIYTVAVPTRWTQAQDLTAADLVLPSIADPAEPLNAECSAALGESFLTLETLRAMHTAREWVRC